MEKRERGSNIIFPIILMLLGRISSGEEGKEISWLRGRINQGKNEKGKQYHLPHKIEAVGKNIKLGRGEEDRNFREENQD